jgi:hypothetical protein
VLDGKSRESQSTSRHAKVLTADLRPRQALVKCIEAFKPTLIHQLACLAATSVQSAALVFEFKFAVKKCLA